MGQRLPSKFQVVIQRVRNNDPSLTTVDFDWEDVGDEGAKELAAALPRNTTVTKLVLWDKHIGNEGIEAIASILRHNNTVIELMLEGNSITERGTEALTRMLRHNSAVSYVSLNGNSVGNGGAKAFARVLSHNCAIAELYLADNNIRDEGAKALAGALVSNRTVKVLELDRNRIGDEGAKALACALSLNISLSQLCLEDNPIGEGGVGALCDAVRILETRDIGQEAAAAFARALFQESSGVLLGPEDVAALRRSLSFSRKEEGILFLFTGLEGITDSVDKTGQPKLLRAVVEAGMIRAALSEEKDHAALMIVERMVMFFGIGFTFEIARARPNLFKIS